MSRAVIVHEFYIEDGVPIPDVQPKYSRGGPKGPLLLAIESMDVGQCMYYKGTQQILSWNANREAKSTGKTFTTKKVSGGVRLWRLS